MADPAALRSLIDRLEKSEGPNRELDICIYAEICDDRDVIAFFSGALRGRSRKPPHDFSTYIYDDPNIPHFTASLDSITALIERDASKWDWSLFSDNGEAIAGCQPASEDGCDDSSEHAPTPALALCIAFLRAKLQEMENVCPQFGVWRSIETAPHGVEVILATRPFACMGEQARWEFKVGFASWGERVGGISNRSYDGHAKFWMPLPSSPKEDAE